MIGQFKVVKITNLVDINESKSLKSSRVDNEIIVVSDKIKISDEGLLFRTGTVMDKNLLKTLNLFKDPLLNEDPDIIGFISRSGVIKPRLIVGIFTTALFLPFSIFKNHKSLKNIDKLKLGTEDFTFNRVKITKRIMPSVFSPRETELSILNKQFKKDLSIKPFFSDYEGLAKDNTAIITEMLEGYSGRCGYLKNQHKNTFLEKLKVLFFNKVYDYEFVFGTKNTMLSNRKSMDYGLAKNFKNKLLKGETVYYTAVGYRNNFQLFVDKFDVNLLKYVMGPASVASIKNIFGDHIDFSYSYKPNNYDIFVHRITNTSESGETIDLSWEQVKRRAKQLKVKTVPELSISFIKTSKKDEEVFNDVYLSTYGSIVKIHRVLDTIVNKKSKLDNKGVVKGVVIRIERGTKNPVFYKHTNSTYNIIDSIAKKKKFFNNFNE